MTGVPEWTPAQRVERVGESLTVLDRLLRGEVVDSAAPHFQVGGAVVRPRPLQRPRPPLVVGALGRRIIALAVRHADAWNTWASFVTDRESAVTAVRRQCDLVTEACERHGRDPATLRRSLCAYGPLDPWRAPTGCRVGRDVPRRWPSTS